MRDELLSIIEKNSRIGINELAVLLGEEEINVANELSKLEQEGVICGYHTLINWDKDLTILQKGFITILRLSLFI